VTKEVNTLLYIIINKYNIIVTATVCALMKNIKHRAKEMNVTKF